MVSYVELGILKVRIQVRRSFFLRYTHVSTAETFTSVIYAAVLGLKVTCVPFSGGTVATAVENDLGKPISHCDR